MNKARGIGFTGSRKVSGYDQVNAFCQLIERLKQDHSRFRHGDCDGWDKRAHRVAKDGGFKIYINPPLDPSQRAFCKADVIEKPKPYLERNHDIVDASRVMVACPSGPEELRSGTWATIRYAKKQRKPLYIVMPDGTLETHNL